MNRCKVWLLLGLLAVALGIGTAQAWGPMVVGGSVSAPAGCAASFVEDDFARGDSGTVAGPWTGETDSGSLLELSGGSLRKTHSATTAAYVAYTKAAAVDEGWVVVKFKSSSLAVGGSVAKSYIFALRDATDNMALYLQGETSGAGNWEGLRLTYKIDGGAATDVGGGYSLTPSADTWYWFKLYWKRSTASDQNDGIAKLWVSTDGATYGDPVINVTNLDFYTYGSMKYFRVGDAFTSAWTATDFYKYWDDAEWRADDCFD